MALAKLQHQYLEPLKLSSLNVDGNLNAVGIINASSFTVNGKPLTVDLSGYITTSSVAQLSSLGIGQTPVFKLDINGGTLSTTSGSQIQVLRLNSNDGNAAYLEITETRTATGSSWTTSGFRLQQKIDSTWMAWEQFTTDLNNAGISWGTGTTTVSPTSISEKMRLDSSGNLTVLSGTISGLAAAGTITNSAQVGYMGIPQNTNPGSSYNIATTDNGKHIYITTNLSALTILANSSLALPIGFSFVIINAAGVTSTIACADTLVLAGTGLIGTRTLAPYAMATLIKITSTSWTISGNGIS